MSQFESRKPGAESTSLSCSVGVMVHKARVYIADSNNKRISVFQTNSYFCLQLGSEQLGCPYDVAVHDSQLFVANHFHHCVYTFALDGYCTGKPATPAKHQLNSPCSVTTHLTGYVFIVNTWNQCVSIFDKSSNYVHSFGQYGSGTGQFKYPNGIAIGPTGSVYITDQDNHRIQVFLNY